MTSPFPGFAHVAITVSDLEASTCWYRSLFDSGPVFDEDEESGAFHHTVFALDNGMLFGLHKHTGVDPTQAYRAEQPGLDHVAFDCGMAELTSWEQRLDVLGISHGGIKRAHYGSGISFRDPDGIALEFFAPPQ
ncbi:MULTISPECIES: VOC family protein [unclassified Mycolicibacterium]|uniref:VOC family protein n=1 Tax=unclassified Mycolicibacterium TaxID=2636767 RepID=UPI001F4C4716|nr:VOC family protein [Mycolicibacterium sp. YH-1]UNB52201.1 VOC family protein [Mycolicibacterium sp. YH-1]